MLPPYELFLLLYAPTSTDAPEGAASLPHWFPLVAGVVATCATAVILTLTLR